MSFPNIPDINPYINIKFEDAINLLLTSIAMEEVSLSKLMDAETKKILCVMDNCNCHDCKHNDCNHKDYLIHDVIEINKSVDNTIKNMIKLQMLLQFKLENIKELLPCTSSTTTTSTSTSTTTTCSKTTTTKSSSSTTTSTSTSTTTTCSKTTTTKSSSSTTTTHTTTCTTSTCSTTTNKGCSCSLIGNGKGCVPNCCDEFFNHMASLYASVYCCYIKNRSIKYSVGKNNSYLQMHASGYNIKMHCPGHYYDKLVIYGKGYAIKHLHCNHNIAGHVDFILTVCKAAANNLEFRMKIYSDTNQKLYHDSGFVQVNCAISDLRLITCC